MLETSALQDLERKLLELRYLEIQEQRKKLDAERQKFKAECAVKAFEDHLEQNVRDRLHIDQKVDASERRANMKANIDQRVEESKDELVFKKRDRIRMLRAQRLAADRKARFGDMKEKANQEITEADKPLERKESKTEESVHEESEMKEEKVILQEQSNQTFFREVEYESVTKNSMMLYNKNDYTNIGVCSIFMNYLSQASACPSVCTTSKSDDERTCKNEVESDNEEKDSRESWNKSIFQPIQHDATECDKVLEYKYTGILSSDEEDSLSSSSFYSQ